MSESYEVPYKELGAMGRAIDAYVLASVRAERDRIIALLEAQISELVSAKDVETTHGVYHAIALIKGEN